MWVVKVYLSDGFYAGYLDEDGRVTKMVTSAWVFVSQQQAAEAARVGKTQIPTLSFVVECVEESYEV